MRRYLSLSIFWIVLLAVTAQADYAVRFSNATVEPGEEFTIDLIIQNDAVLGGAVVPFRWSSASISLLQVEILTDRLIGNVTWFVTVPDQVKRTSGILIIGNREDSWIAVGNSPVARITFRAGAAAPDEYVFVDSIFEKRGDIVLQSVSFSNFNGSQSIFPPTYPGVITIGNPPPATISVTPSSFTLLGESGGLEPTLRSLQIQSDGVVQFDWEANWSSDWLDVTPSIGKTPAFPTVAADAFFLLPGVYRDTIVISSPIAENSPLLIPIAFTVDTAGTRPPAGFNFTLLQNRPNPFVAYSDPETVSPFLLEESDRVEIAIYDILGRRVRTFMSAQYDAGESSVIWDGRDSRGRVVASGHYICRMTTSAGESSRVIVLIR